MSKTTFGVMADVHCHNWSAFSSVMEDGINSRLHETMMAIRQACRALYDAAGPNATMYIAGDVFHVRGSVAPSVFNPIRALLGEMVSTYSMVFEIMSGNHDMEFRHASTLGDAVQALQQPGVNVTSAPRLTRDGVLMMPWIEAPEELMDALKKCSMQYAAERAAMTLMLHAPIDDVIPGLPSHGITPAFLQSLGFGRVLSGHYHHHKHLGGNVWSIGALTHQNWNDPDTLAGFMLVPTNPGLAPRHVETSAPKFVNLDPTLPVSVVEQMVKGNYVRVRGIFPNESSVVAYRDQVVAFGARGVVMMPVRNQQVVTRSSSAVTAAAGSSFSLGGVIKQFISDKSFANASAVEGEAMKILQETLDAMA